MISITRVLIALAAIAVLSAACSSSGASAPTVVPKATPTVGSTPAPQDSPTPTAPPSAVKKVLEPAPVNSVEIEVDRGSAELVLVTGLPNACYESSDHTVTQDGKSITVSVMNLGPGDSLVACAEIYRLDERRIPLRRVIEPCAVYSVEVNGETYEVQALGPAIRCRAPEPTVVVEPPQDSDPGDGMRPVLAPIDGVDIEVAESAPPQYFLVVQSGLPNGCARFDGYTVERQGATVVVRVTNLVPEDKNVMCTMVYGTVVTRVPLGSDFEPGRHYTVQVNDVTHPLVAQSGGSSEGGPIQVTRLDEPFKIKEGDSAALVSESLEVRFDAVVSDSRCPANVTCIWAGEAKVAVSLADSSGNEIGKVELTIGADPDAAYANVGDYSIALMALDPYPGTPEAERQGDDPEYAAVLLVSGAFLANDGDPGPTAIDFRADPVPGQALTVLFTAEISGGRDSSQDLYCQGTSWEFGDGMGVASMPGCLMWTPNATFPRHHEQTYTYEKAGTYEATFAYGPLGPVTVKVEVR
ncbi:MAG: hypothetical protein O3A47_11225 [Chloroflexi bacterium]|nr:hypothetical protein [Chloroflexota bacterium]